MRIISELAEERLGDILRIKSVSSTSNFVLQIKALHFNITDFQLLPELVKSWIGDEDGDIIICHDRDIFIFSPNLSPTIFSQFKEHFQTRFEYEYDFVRQGRSLSFYNLRESSLALIELAETKLVKQKIQKSLELKKHNADKKTAQREDFIKFVPSTHQAGTLDQRRRARATLEILIVEDDPFSRKLISNALVGANTVFAEDGYSAVINHVQKAPDIVFLDINLPDVSGFDVLFKILSLDKHAYVVMLSGNSQGENVKAAIQSGAKGFIGKPFTKEKLLHYISKCPKNQLMHTKA